MTRTRTALVGMAIGCLAAVGLAYAPAAMAAPAADGTFPVTSVGTNNQITRGPDDNMWVTLDGATTNVAKITPAGVVTEFDLPGVSSPVGITAAAGNLWVTVNGGVARFDPADPLNPATTVSTPIAAITDPRSITVGPDDNLWTASTDKVVKIPPATPATATTYAATGVTGARAIARSGDYLWVADFGGAQVVRVATDGTGTPFATGGGPQGVAGGANGQVAYANPGTNPHTIGLISGTSPITTVASPPGGPVRRHLRQRPGVLGGAVCDQQPGAGHGGRGVDHSDQLRSRIRTPADRHRTRWHPVGHPGHRRSGGAGHRGDGADSHAVDSRYDDHQGAEGQGHDQEPRKRLTFRFTSSKASSTFQCRLDRKGAATPPWRTCATPKSYAKRPGRYTFTVRATAQGKTDPTPAKSKFKVVRR